MRRYSSLPLSTCFLLPGSLALFFKEKQPIWDSASLSPFVAPLDFLGVEKREKRQCGECLNVEGTLRMKEVFPILFVGLLIVVLVMPADMSWSPPWQEGSELSIQSAGIKTLSLLHGCTRPFCF